MSVDDTGLATTSLAESDLDKLLAAEPMLKYFRFDHLPAPLAQVSEQFFNLAAMLVTEVPRCPERTVAMRKLLEGKDAAVRAKLSP